MTTVTIQIEGIDAVVDKLNTIEQMRGFQAALTQVGQHVRDKIKTYPQSTEANQPRSFVSGGKNTWYERGYGPKWARKDGTIGGRKTSEILKQSWGVQATNTQVVIGTKVTYAPYVHDADEQASFHKRRGWKTAQQVAKEEEPAVRRFIEDYLEKLMK